MSDRSLTSRAAGGARALRRLRSIARGGVNPHRHKDLERQLADARTDLRRAQRTSSQHEERLRDQRSALEKEKARAAKEHAALSEEVAALRAEVAQLHADLQQERGLGLRTAELLDVVTELLAAAGDGPDQLREAARRYADAL